MICSQCHTPNFSDYKYCRECGTRLPPGPAPGTLAPGGESLAEGEDVRVEQFLQAGFTHLEAGRPEEALGSVQSALALEPESAVALSTLSLVYERQGRLPEAVEALEQALRINPASTADREKLNALLARAGRPAVGAPSRPRLLLAAGVGGVLLVCAAGVYLVGMGGKDGGNEAAPPRLQAAANNPMPVTVGGPGPRAVGPVGPPAPTPNQPAPPVASAPSYPPAQAPRPAGERRTDLPQRIGLPTVVHQPPTVPGVGAGLPPALIRDVVPLTPPGAPGPPGVPAAGAAPGGAEQTAAPAETAARPRELLEPETGFIRIEPVTGPRPNGTPGTQGGSAAGAAGAAPAPAEAARPGVPPTITLSISRGGESFPLEDARRAHRMGMEAFRRGNGVDAQRYLTYAARVYENEARRGGAGAREAQQGLELCRRALGQIR